MILSLALLAGQVRAQYPLPQDQPAATDSTDSLKTPAVNERLEQGERTATPPAADEDKPKQTSIDEVRTLANQWVRRLLFRGWLDTSHIGAWAEYQITGWNENTGSFGPVEARITVYYLGSTVWLGKDAEWVQVSFHNMDEEETQIDYDLILPAREKIDEVYRALYRIDQNEIQTTTFVLPEGEMDYDKEDQPHDAGDREIKLYVGTFETQIYAGSGTNGAVVYTFRSHELPPLGVVVLGYGGKALTVTSRGASAKPRMNVPPPPER
jgi:hypothetical protein